MTITSTKNSSGTLRSASMRTSFATASRASVFRSSASLSQSLPVWQNVSLTHLVIDDLNRLLQGKLSESQLTNIESRLALYFSTERDSAFHEALAQELEPQLVELECQERLAELELHTAEALFSWANLIWVDQWPVGEQAVPGNLYVQRSPTPAQQLIFWAHDMLQPIRVDVAEGVSAAQMQSYQQSNTDMVLQEALQCVRNIHIQQIVLSKVEIERLIDAEIGEVLSSFAETIAAHASATVDEVREQRGLHLSERLQAKREELVTQLLALSGQERLDYLSQVARVSQEIDTMRINHAMRLGDHEATVADTQVAIMNSPRLARCSKTELAETKQRVAKQTIDLTYFDEDQTLLDKVIALKDIRWVTVLFAYAEHLDHHKPTPLLLANVGDEEILSDLIMAGQSASHGLDDESLLLEDLSSTQAQMPVVVTSTKAWLIACALMGTYFDESVRLLVQHGCLFDPDLMQQVYAAAPAVQQALLQQKIMSLEGYDAAFVASGDPFIGLSYIDGESSQSSLLSDSGGSSPIPKLCLTLHQLFDEGYRLKSEFLAGLIYPATDGLSAVFIEELMRRYDPETLQWPPEISSAIVQRHAYNQRESEHFDILTEHCCQSLTYLTTQYLRCSADHDKTWYEQKLKTELAIIQGAYHGQMYQDAPVNIRALFMQNRCLRERKTCKPSTALGLVPRSSPATVSEIASLEAPASAEDAKALLLTLKFSAEERQMHAKKYFLAKQVFKKTLRYLDRTHVHNQAKKDVLLTVCHRFSKGELDDAASLLRELTQPGSLSREALWHRRDHKAKAAKSYGHLTSDWQNREALLHDLPKLLQAPASY